MFKDVQQQSFINPTPYLKTVFVHRITSLKATTAVFSQAN